jgi:putative membrane protein
VSAFAHGAEPLTAAAFVSKAAEASHAEVELGKLVEEKGKSKELKEFGHRMIVEHTRTGEELKKMATEKKIAIPAAMSAAHKTELDKLRQKTGKDFDDAFAQHMAIDHSAAVDLFTTAQTLQDKDLAAFATRTLPTLKEHQLEAVKLAKK